MNEQQVPNSMAGGSNKSLQNRPLCQVVSIYVGATWRGLCPMASKLAYMALQGNLTWPLFMFRNGQFLTRVRFVSALWEALHSSGIDTSLYSGHSFRIGEALTAALHGLQGCLIQTLGR